VAGGIAGAIYSLRANDGRGVSWRHVATGAAIGGAIGLTGGAGLAYLTTGSALSSSAVVGVGTKVSISAIGTSGYGTFQQFKKSYGPAGGGKAYHHIVNQTATNVKKFGAEAIHHANNIVKIPHGAGEIHMKISGYYSSIDRNIHRSMTVGQWLETQTWTSQYQFGLRMLVKLAQQLRATLEYVNKR